MTLLEFLFELTVFFPIRGAKKDDDIEKVLKSYEEHLAPSVNGKGYDFKKLLRWIVDNYEYKAFPEVSFIKNNLSKGAIFNSSSKAGQLVVVSLPDGREYQFTVSGFGFNSIGDLKNKLYRHYGENSKFQFYPAGTVIIDGQVFTPNE